MKRRTEQSSVRNTINFGRPPLAAVFDGDKRVRLVRVLWARALLLASIQNRQARRFLKEKYCSGGQP